jgi:hypothetical protein
MNSTQPADNTHIRDRITTLEDEIVKLRDRLDAALTPSAQTAETTRDPQPARTSRRGWNR